METIGSSNLVLAFQILISVLVLMVVGYFYVKIRKKSKQVDIVREKADIDKGQVDIASKANDTPPAVVAPVTAPPERDLMNAGYCPSCGSEMKEGDEFCEDCGYGMN